jgi:hypothetical protein
VIAKLRERLSVSKRAALKFDMQRFDLRKLNNAEVRNSIKSKSQRSLQLWKTWMIMWTSVGLGEILERKSKFQPKRIWVIMS